MAALRSPTFLESKMSIQSDGASVALIDEVDRYVVRLPVDASFHCMPVFVPVAFDRQADGGMDAGLARWRGLAAALPGAAKRASAK